MDVLTAEAGLTRGALYYHFGGKKGLLEAVIDQIEGEMALEPETQRILLLDGPAVLGDPS
jgi:AcrR family transcriptional regulator